MCGKKINWRLIFLMRGGNNLCEQLDPKLRPSSEVIEGDANFMKNAYRDHSSCGLHFYLNLGLVSPLLNLLEMIHKYCSPSVTHPPIPHNVSYLKWTPGGTLILTTVEETRKEQGLEQNMDAKEQRILKQSWVRGQGWTRPEAWNSYHFRNLEMSLQ